MFFPLEIAGRAGGALLLSGVAAIDRCTFASNHAPLGPAISNTVSVGLNGTEFSNNTLTCNDDGLFLDWADVSCRQFRSGFSDAAAFGCSAAILVFFPPL